ncbi:MAG: hypothetical protein ACFCVG_01295 [Kineosporiaceae bacterium]
MAGAPRGHRGDPLTVDRRLLVLGGVLATLSLGLPWGTGPDAAPGFGQPARVLVPVAAALVWWGVRRGSRAAAWSGPAVAGVALTSSGAAGAGPVLLSGAVLVVAVALVRAGPTVTPGEEGRDPRDDEDAAPAPGEDPQPAARPR